MSESTAIVVIESMTPVQLFTPGAIDPLLDRIKSEVRSIVTDISTESGRKAVASLAYKVGRSKTFIDAQRKALVSDEKKRLAEIDKEGKRVWDELESLQKEVRQPLTDWENADKDRIAQHEAQLAEIIEAGPYTLQNWQTLPIEAMQDRIAEIHGDKRDWQEFYGRATVAKSEAVKAITSAIDKRKTYDSEQSELVRLRQEAAEREQKQREEAIAQRSAAETEARLKRESEEREERERAAKEKAIREKQDAELATQRAIDKAAADAKAAAEKAEQEKQAAIQRERERVASEQRAVEEAEAKREANKRHCAKINREALNAFLSAGFDESTGKAIIALIAKGDVPHVKISY